MRIIYDHQVFSLQDAGGASRYHCELIRHLSAQPNLTINALLGFTGHSSTLKALRSDRVRLWGFGPALNPGVTRYVLNEAISSVAVASIGPQDIYHSTLYRFLPLVRAKRRVVTHHDCVHERFPQLFSDGERVVRAKRKLFDCADAVICVSESSQRDLEEFYRMPRDRTRVIHHGISPLPRSPKAADELSRTLRREFLLFVGSRAAYKNFPLLLKAFRGSGLSQSHDLVAVGGGPFTETERNLIAELGIAPAVLGISRAADDLLAEAYARATLLVYPSLYEGFGFPPLEAMSLGCPVVVARSSSLPEVCLDAAFYFDPSSHESLSNVLLRAISDTAARDIAIKRGREVVARFSWESCSAATLDFYRHCS